MFLLDDEKLPPEKHQFNAIPKMDEDDNHDVKVFSEYLSKLLKEMEKDWNRDESGDKDSLEAHRRSIDIIDQKILLLLLERFEVAKKIAELKLAQGSTQVYRADRENEILDRRTDAIAPQNRYLFKNIYREIMKASREFQYKYMLDKLTYASSQYEFLVERNIALQDSDGL